MYSTHKTLDGKKRPTRQGDPVDAEELSHRLTAYLAQQNKKSFKYRETRIGRSITSRGHRIKENCDRKSQDEPDFLEDSTLKTAIRDSPRVIHKFPRHLLKYQRHLENRFYVAKLNSNHSKSLDYRERHHSQPNSRLRRNIHPWEESSSVEGSGQALNDPSVPSRQRIFHIHTLLGHTSGRRWKSGQTSSDSQENTTEDSRNSAEQTRPETNNSVWISVDDSSRRSRDTSTYQGKKWDWSFMPQSKKMTRDPCSDRTSIRSPEISPSPRSRLKFRNSIVALFRRNTNT